MQVQLLQLQQRTIILSVTVPLSGSKPRYTMSPPSSCTAGLMRVSSSSLIIATICTEQQQQAHERVCKQ
jgi:hypothetical protein